MYRNVTQVSACIYTVVTLCSETEVRNGKVKAEVKILEQ